MKRAINGLLLAFFSIYSASCQRHGPAEAATEGIRVGETRANVELLLKDRGIKFKSSPPLADTSTFPTEMIQEEALESSTLTFFVFEPPVNAITKITRVIVVFDQNGRVDRILTKESNLGL
ncbi:MULTISPECIES: hypothetical protein [Lysobacter]|uniref:hypothetical protein n=1 Tax=Lysobacter TaxID=68 RepID=UPI001F318F3C|nr:MULTISPECIES: hypothetical protein [Lysobacter]UJB18477.1 hypothetical protein L1A79_19410 [Lysobacter capsici]UJQ27798.1 hypothetical protein L2D09_20475 [Lysobacter gummosus]